MTENLTIDLVGLQTDSIDDPLQDIYDNLKSPDRSKSWKGSRLRRSKTYSGSPSNKLGTENVPANKGSDAPVAPLSPVNQKKWGKTNMKRRSSNAQQRLHKSLDSDRHQSSVITADCAALSTHKIEVRHSSDISNNAIMHKYSCPCKQYLDESSGIIYKLQVHQSFDRNVKESQHLEVKCRDLLSPLDILSTSIMEEDVQEIHSSTPISHANIQTFAENTKAENITISEFNFDFQSLDDTVMELQTLQSDLRDAVLHDAWSGVDSGSCCNQKSVDKRKISSSILESMSDSEGSIVYLLISVFSYLDVGSVYEAGRVCRTWHCASQHPAVWRNLTLQNKTLTPQAFRSLSLTCVSTQQLRISQCNVLYDSPSIEVDIRRFFTTIGSTLKTLYLSSNNDNDMILDSALVHCTGLSRLHTSSKLTDNQMESLATSFPLLTCLSISNTQGLNMTQFYEMETVKCFTFNAASLRVDEIQNIVDWFPSLHNLHILNGRSLHSNHVRNLFSPESLVNLSFTDTYVTPRALLYLLCTCRKLETLNLYYTHAFTDKTTFQTSYMTSIQEITENVLFRDVLRVKFAFGQPVKSTPRHVAPDGPAPRRCAEVFELEDI